jgi:predicted naringenin-chalcone synthase
MKNQLTKMITKNVKDENNEQMNEIIKMNSEIENNNKKPIKRLTSSHQIIEKEKLYLEYGEEMLS